MANTLLTRGENEGKWITYAAAAVGGGTAFQRTIICQPPPSQAFGVVLLFSFCCASERKGKQNCKKLVATPLFDSPSQMDAKARGSQYSQ